MCELKNDILLQLANGTILEITLLKQDVQIIFGLGTTTDKSESYAVQMKICKTQVEIILMQSIFLHGDYRIDHHVCIFKGCPWESKDLYGAQRTNYRAVGSCKYTLVSVGKMIPFDM